MKKTVIYKLSAIMAVVAAAASCSDFLDKKNPSYDTEGFYETEAGLREGVTGVYSACYFEQNWDVPFVIVADHYTAYGLEQNENNSIGAGGGLNPDQSYVQTLWSGAYTIIARANSVIYGARDNIANMSDEAHQYYAEARVVRAYAYYLLVSAFGDVPFFTSPVTVDQYNAGRTPKGEIINYLIEDVDDAANDLDWTAPQRGRVDKSTAYGLISRMALFAGSFNVDGKGAEYFRKAADYAQMVIGQRHLADNFHDLFTPEGQTKSDVQDEILWELVYSNDASKMTQTVGYGHSSRYYGSSVRFPSSLIVDTYECKDGLRIDESPLYDPTHPTRNRDPRFRETLAGHGDTIDFYNGSAMKMVLNIYDEKTRFYPRRNNWYNAQNTDVTTTAPSIVNTGVGYVWRKYANYATEMLQAATTNIILMRYAEILLNYAEAKIELGELDQTVYDAIDEVRGRVGMPGVSADRKGNIDKMRQLVRRERKVELALEGLLFVDVRRWGICDLLNQYPSYGQPLADVRYEGMAGCIPNFKASERNDLNDIAVYTGYADKLRVRDRNRYWDDKFTWWPIPRTETDRDPNLTNPGY